MKYTRSILFGALIAGVVWWPAALVAQVDTLEWDKSVQEAQETAQESIEMAREQLQEAQKELRDVGISITFDDKESYSQRKLQFGLYLENLDFEDAYKRHYPYNYGVLVTGVVHGGNAERAGIVKGDIIMEFDGEKVRYEDHLLSLRDTKKFGDTITLTIFRNENIIERSLTFNPPAPKTELDKEGKIIDKKKPLSVGYGGGGPMVIIVDFDFPGISTLLQSNGFDPLSVPATFYGGFGMGNVGKGLFIGGGGAGYTAQQQIKKTSGDGYKCYSLESGFGGVMLHKKKALFTKKLILDVGLLLGGGSTVITVSSTDGDFSWNSDIENTINSESFTYQKNYFVYQPSVGLLVRVTNWFGVNGSVGYLGTYSADNSWKEANFDFTVADGNPEIFNSLAYTVGIWFGY